MLGNQVQRSSGSLTSLHRSPLSAAQMSGSPHARSASPQPRARVNSFVASSPALSSPTPPWMEIGPRSSSSAAAIAAPGPEAPSVPSIPVLGTDLRWPTDFKQEYLLGKCIGSGAFGTVHLAIHRSSGQQVAVKIMAKTRAKQTKDKTLAKLQREVEMLNSLGNSEHIVKLQAKFEDKDFAYLVMEHCSGGDLDHLLEVSHLQSLMAKRHTWHLLSVYLYNTCACINPPYLVDLQHISLHHIYLRYGCACAS